MWYPTRLLDIGSSASDLVRVIDTASIQPKGGYVTLSHRWGDKVFIKLTKTSASSLRVGVPIGSLPLTFQQAAEVARRLQKRYLWIDSLCVFQNQDDKLDGLKEAALMERMYSNICSTSRQQGPTAIPKDCS